MKIRGCIKSSAQGSLLFIIFLPMLPFIVVGWVFVGVPIVLFQGICNFAVRVVMNDDINHNEILGAEREIYCFPIIPWLVGGKLQQRHVFRVTKARQKYIQWDDPDLGRMSKWETIKLIKPRRRQS